MWWWLTSNQRGKEPKCRKRLLWEFCSSVVEFITRMYANTCSEHNNCRLVAKILPTMGYSYSHTNKKYYIGSLSFPCATEGMEMRYQKCVPWRRLQWYNYLALFLSYFCKIKSGSGLETRLATTIIVTYRKHGYIHPSLQHIHKVTGIGS